jgi:DNA-binding MarR family transcriptional regulator
VTAQTPPAGSADRPDLAAMFAPLSRALIEAERPVLAAHGLTMWGYAVLLRLEDEPFRTQSALAGSIGADKTRLIPVLDALQQDGLIRRAPDPRDRRVHLLSLTPEGRTRRDATQAAIQAAEERLLARLPEGDRAALLRALQALGPLLAKQQAVAAADSDA